MLIDLHAHTSGISTCCKANGAAALTAAKAAGIDGICLCNHYHKPYLQVTGESPAAFAARYLEEYASVQSLGRQMGVRVFFGIEVTMECRSNVHVLIYGVEPDFVLQHTEMFDYTEQQLCDVVHESGGILVQAHPMRQGKNVLLEPKYLDGVEISNHLLYDGTHYDELAAFAMQHGLLLTSGGDYHADTPRPKCGVYLPNEPLTTREIAHYLQNTPRIRLCLQESGELPSRDVVFQRCINP